MWTVHSARAEQEKLADGILLATYEAVTLEDLGSEVLPLFDRLLDTSTSMIYRANADGAIIAIDGTLAEGHYVYARTYYAVDPLQTWLRELNPAMLHSAGMPDYQHYLEHPAHTECSAHYGFDNCLHLRLNERGMHQPGMVGMVLARTSGQPDFSERERMSVARLMPALEAAVRRSERLENSTRSQGFLESILDNEARPTLALDARGDLVWASSQAAAWLDLDRRKELPAKLSEAARRLGDLIGKKPTATPPLSWVSICHKDGSPLRAELRLARTRSGAYFIVAELDDIQKATTSGAEARYGLTAAEAHVLGLLALGLSDKGISRRLFVSTATVHSHVNRILGKMGLRSRVQAALLARGQAVETEDEE